MRAPRGGHTMKQMAYARRVLSPGDSQTKEDIARSVGYSPAVCRSVKSHIENTVGFHAASAKLASEANNAALKVMHEFNARGMNSFTNKELITAVGVIASAWEKYNKVNMPKEEPVTATGNRLKAVVMRHIDGKVVDIKGEDQLIKEGDILEEVQVDVEITPDDDPNDF